MRDKAEIYCPKCGYRPKAEDRWGCVRACGTIWNTFWTGGVCPGCGKQWQVTQCPRCKKRSPHQDWYHYPEGGEAKREEEAVEEEKA